MSNPEIITDQGAAEEVIRGQCSGARDIRFIHHGYHNLIAAVDKQYIFRFPRDEQSLGRFGFELEVLEELDGKLTIQTPKILKKSLHPAYAMMSYVPGEQLENKQLRSLTDDAQKAIGEQLSQFVQEFNGVVSIEKMQALHQKTNADKALEPWQQYLGRVFASRQNSVELQAFVDKYYTEWLAVVAKDKPQVVVHDDLHSGNLLFQDGRLTGILDFEHATIGTIEQEFRYLYRQGGSVLRHTVAAYKQATGQTVNADDMRVWAITSELAAFVRRLNSGDTAHDSFVRAHKKLTHWLPDFPR